ncbi:MAG: DUF507 family protein [Deltaproteobacteria bacterium]|nr:DUF507 family protein [Deltaproteobacteria bacterium]
MRIAQDRLQGIARAIVDDLVRADAIVLGTSHEAAITAVLGELEAYFKAEATLERDAERMADQHLKAAGRDGVGLDRKRVVQMIKTKLAQERGFPA